MNIAYSCSRTWYPYLKATITSLLEHNSPTKIYILAEDDELPFEIPCKHEVINVSGQTYFPPDSPNMVRNAFSYMAMIRICLPELIKASKVICLDVDTVICDSLQPLWDIPLKDKWVAWCPEHSGWYKPFGPRYYNFGVAVLNLTQMRKDDAVRILVDDLNAVHLWCPEQDALNLEAAEKRSVDIPVRYNECFCCGYTDNPAVVHYAGHADWMTSKSIYRWEYLDKYLK